MGMYLVLKTASDTTIQRLLADPDSIESFLYPDEPDADDSPSDEGIEVDLDKAWHAIHFLLCGSADEGTGTAAFFLSGGTPIGDIDIGYGPARAMTAAQVADIAGFLEKLPPETLVQRYDAGKLDATDIYPNIWRRDGENAKAYLRDSYDTLRQHMATTARNRMGMVIALS